VVVAASTVAIVAIAAAVIVVALLALYVLPRTTRPYRPRTNGKAERFIQTLLREWAYNRLYRNSHERADSLPGWLSYYNYNRPHGSLNRQAPATRLRQLNNVAGNYT